MLSLESAKNHLSDEPLVLDADAKASSLKTIQSVFGALQFLKEMITKDTPTVSIRYNTLSISRHAIKDLTKVLGGEEDLQQDADLKQKMLQNANAEVHRLTAELGKGITKEGVAVKIGQMCEEVSKWWKEQGFGYTKATISGWSSGASVTVDFNCDPDNFTSSFEEKPITAKAKLKEKQANLGKKMTLVPEEPGSDRRLLTLDCPKNRKYIIGLLKSRFPGIRIHKWDSHSVHGTNSEQFYIDRCHANFPVEDI